MYLAQGPRQRRASPCSVALPIPLELGLGIATVSYDLFGAEARGF